MAEEKLIRNPKLIIGEAEKVEAEVVGADDIVVVTDEEFYTAKEVDDLLKKSGGASLPILTSIWSDHLVNDMSWLRADTFSWQSGDVYKAAYEHLANELLAQTNAPIYAWEHEVTGNVYYTTTLTPSAGDKTIDGNDITSVGADYIIVKGANCYRDSSKDSTTPLSKTETIGDITITYYLAEDGHKICLPDQESNLSALYEATGVAWYYILDTTNKQFKLPRTKWGFTGLRDSVGGYVAPGLPNITGTYDGIVYLSSYNSTSVPMTGTGALYNVKNSSGTMHITSSQGANRTTKVIGLDASKSNATYGNSDTVQSPATQMYLYFYVGNFEQSAVEQTAGLNTEMFNNKADISLFNAIYPVGSIYIGTQSTCPMEIAIPGSSWELLEAGRALWTGDGSNGDTTIAAGLPNITGSIGATEAKTGVSGAFYAGSSVSGQYHRANNGTQSLINLDASRSSSVYGKSSTVQPPAYVVNVWRRTA